MIKRVCSLYWAVAKDPVISGNNRFPVRTVFQLNQMYAVNTTDKIFTADNVNHTKIGAKNCTDNNQMKETTNAMTPQLRFPRWVSDRCDPAVRQSYIKMVFQAS